MSLLTREASSEARQHGEPSIVPCPTVKSATSAFCLSGCFAFGCRGVGQFSSAS